MKLQINIITWLAYWWFPDVTNSREAIEQFFIKIELWSLAKGDLWVINHLKEIQLLYTRHLCGDPVKKSNRFIGIRKDGLPKGLTHLNYSYLSHKEQGIRFTLTLLSVYRTIKAWKEPDLTTITNCYSGLEFDFNDDFKSFALIFFKEFKIRPFSPKWDRSNYYYSKKSGPNGLATIMAIIDAIKAPESLVDHLSILSMTISQEVRHWRTFSDKVFIYLRSNPRQKMIDYVRKLSVVQDPGGKSRIIAIFDYYSQNVLKTIHDEVFIILKQFPQDRAFNQDPKVDFDGPYYSFDLTAATDRFPMALQVGLMKILIGEAKANAWKEIMTAYEFYVPWEDKTVKYTVGQPMGAYSSWGVFSLSHHFIVQYCAYLIGEFPTRNYILLGDDIVIGGSELAETYKQVISSLGVGISSHKTHVSQNTYEFAKRWFRNNVEISPIQINAFMTTYKSYPLLFQTIRTYYERGLYPRLPTSYPELVTTLLVLCGMFQRKAENISRKVEMLHGFYRWIHDGDKSAIRRTLIHLFPNDASIPNENHPLFQFLLEMRFDMAYQVIHKSAVDRVEKMLVKIPDIISNLSTIVSPDQGTKGDDIDYNDLDSLLAVEEIDISELLMSDEVLTSDSFSYSDCHNFPVSLSLRNILKRLSEDERISIANMDLTEHIEALVIPEIDNIMSKDRKAGVLIKQNILAQKVLHFHKVLAKGAGWMFETQWFQRNGWPMNQLSSNPFLDADNGN